MGRALAALFAAALAGTAGLALQVQLASAAARPLGSGTGPALALAAWLAAWALGAWLAGRARARPAIALLALGLALACAGMPALIATVRGGPALALVCILGTAALQGAFLPFLVGNRSDKLVALLWAANLAGAWIGARWIAHDVVAHFGRVPAALVAGACALAAGALGAAAVRGLRAPDMAPEAPASQSPALGRIAGALAIGLGTALMSALEWSLVRLGALWFGGMQDALSAVLAASLAALALGALVLPPLLPRGARGVAVGLGLCALAATWPLAAHLALEPLAEKPLALRALALCIPALAPFGALVPLVHRARGGESGRALGDLLLHETWGAALGIPLAQLALTPWIGLAGGLGALALLFAAAPLAVLPRARLAGAAAALAAVGAALALLAAEPPALRAAPLANPVYALRSFAEDRDFAVSVVDDGMLGERTLLTDGFRAAGTGRDYLYMRALGHLPLLLHPDPRRVAVVALGTGTTVGAVSLHEAVERIDVLEISRAVVAAAPHFAEHNRGALAEGLPGLLDPDDGAGRVVVRLGDARKTLRDSPGAYDVVTMEPLLPDSPFGVHLYTEEAYADVKRALKPGGIACQWVPPHALATPAFHAVTETFGRSFGWTGAWLSGTQLLLIGSDVEPAVASARWTGGDELQRELELLGLGDPRSLAARQRGRIRGGDSGGRPLTDLDPWIAFAPRLAGDELLKEFPANLLAILEVRTTSWRTGFLESELPSDEGQLLSRALRALDAQRYAAAIEEYLQVHPEKRGYFLPSPDDGAVLRAARASEPDVARFLDEREFLADLRGGVAVLGSTRNREGALLALDPLTRAAELRPERADVHAYVAAALARIESPAAEKALEAALERCPRLADTPQGERARSLGLTDALWIIARERAGRTRP